MAALEKDCFRCNLCQETTQTLSEEGARPEGLLLQCSHVYCYRCLHDYFVRQIYAFTISPLICPIPGCGVSLEPQFVQMLLPPSAVARDERKRAIATSMFKASAKP